MSEKNANTNDVLEDLKSIGLVLGGVVIGSLMDVGAQKILKLDRNASLSGIAEMKKFISPAVKIVGGGAGAYFVPNKTARLLLGGVAVSGASSMVGYGLKKVLNKSDSSVSGFGEIDYQAIDEHHENMVLDNYDPEFPELSIDGAPEDEMELIERAIPVPKGAYSSEEEEFDDAEIM